MSFGGRVPQHQVDFAGLKLTGMRVGPIDPETKVAKVGLRPEAYTKPKDFHEQTIFVKKDLSGFGAGFKIPEEYRKRKLKMRADKKKKEEDEADDEGDDNAVTKEEILAHLQLGNAEGGIGAGKYGADSKKALANDLVEGLEKDLERLKRFEENIRHRKLMTMKGGAAILEETDQMRHDAEIDAIHKQVLGEGAHIISADQKRLQLLRHKAGQLDSLKDLDINELERQRVALAEKSRELNEAYLSRKENSLAGKLMRRKMGMTEPKLVREQESSDERELDEVVPQEDNEAVPIKSGKSSGKHVRISEKELGPTGGINRGKPMKSAINYERDEVDVRSKSRGQSQGRSAGKSAGRSAGRSEGRSAEQFNQCSPRRQIYEAKFDKFKANKAEKDRITQKHNAMKMPNFDITTKGASSPSKLAQKFKPTFGASLEHQPSGKYDPDQLMPEGYEHHLMREELLRTDKDPFRVLGVSNEDKMSFFLLKWVYNAIKCDSLDNDEILKGQSYVKKNELVKQLVKNPEIMSALQIENQRKLQDQLRNAACMKDGCLTWQEFLDFFFLKEASLQDRIDGGDWWQKLDQEGQPVKEPTPLKSRDLSDFSDKENDDSNNVGKNDRRSRLLAEFEEVKMTPALEQLIKTRKQKVSQDVEDDFNNMQQKQMGFGMIKDPASKKKQTGGFSTMDGSIKQEEIDAQLGIAREKSQCLLLPSQVETMRLEYEKIDKYNDQILKRSDYLMALRTEQRVVDFIDVDAVKVAGAKRKIMTLDQVLTEIEKDETYEQMQMAKTENAINHKEFITWREFLNYFEDYREIEERNKKSKQIEKTRENIQKMIDPQQNDQNDPDEEFKSLMETEKERRLQELPTIRPADQIDISEEQLQLIKDIYDANREGNSINTVTFFMSLRKNPEISKINSAIARDPEGTSRIPKETFQQVFDRMERELQQKSIDWATIIEYFTKLGRPLSKEEIKKLQDEDRRIREEQEEQKRREQEAEQRKMARLMDEMQGEEDYETFQKRQKQEDSFNQDLKPDQRQGSDEELRSLGSEFDSDASGDDLERDYGGQVMIRNASAKGLGGQNLRNQRLTHQDYIGGSRPKSGGRKGRYGITVPKPFAFDIRDSVKPKSIRERKVEQMIQEKKAEEDGMKRHQFRSKPIPAAVLVPRYQSILDKNEERRMKVKQESIAMTKATEQPFDFWERDKKKMEAKRNQDPNAGLAADCQRPNFKANKIPAFCAFPFYEEDLRQKELARKEKIKKMAKESYAKAKMPSRMEQASLNEKNNPKEIKQEQFSFQPHINEPKDAATFKKLQDAFLKKLNKTKSEATVTVPKSPNFKQTKSKPLERTYVNETTKPPMSTAVAQAAGGDKLKATLAAKSMKSSTSQGPVKQPASTKATALQAESRRKDIEKKKAQELQKQKEDEARTRMQNQMKGTVQGALRGTLKDAQTQIEQAAKERREADRKATRDQKEVINNAKAKGRERPLLIDSYNSKRNNNFAKLQNLKKFTEIMKESGMKQKDIDARMTEEDKELLAEEKYMQKRREQLGRGKPKEEEEKLTKKEADDKYGTMY